MLYSFYWKNTVLGAKKEKEKIKKKSLLTSRRAEYNDKGEINFNHVMIVSYFYSYIVHEGLEGDAWISMISNIDETLIKPYLGLFKCIIVVVGIYVFTKDKRM